VRIRQLVEPRFDYGTVAPWIRHHGGGLYSAIGGDDGLLCFSDAGLEPDGERRLVAAASVHEGERIRLSLEFRRPETLEDGVEAPAPADLDAALEATVAAWREWASRTHPDVADERGVRRSALVLKALTYEPTGAMVAAATTSLPEGVEGTRTWDYRYSWIRDAHLASGCLTDLGYEAEAGAFRRFIERSSAGSADDLHMFYGVGGERRLQEAELPELAGWGGAQPVRIGNNAVGQVQLDAYGHLVSQSWRWYRLGHPPDDDYWRFIVDLVDAAVERWHEQDAGIWEWRGDGKHFVYSKAQCWVAVNLGLKLAEECMRKAPERRWRKARDEIREAVEAKGFDASRGTFLQAFGEKGLDAAVLRLAAIGFVEYDDPRMVSTADVIAAELCDGGLIRRYDADDGLPGHEATFLPCTFWLVELLARQGRGELAREWFDRAVATANELGLYAEEFDPAAKRMMGNFPQALTHLAHIEAALALGE
jgi:GH15 family glucan-1,4-alpha-glucosidase